MSESITVTLPDGSQKQTARGTTIADFVKGSIGVGLAKAALFARVNGQDMDLARTLDEDAKLQIFTSKSPEGLDLIRHDAAHVVASAVQKLFPGTQVTIGPSTEEGFYYDFFREKPFTPEELEKIEAAANAELKQDAPFVRTEISMEDAIKLFEEKGEKFKVEIVKDIAAKGAKTLTLYTHGDWVDFCLGPHAPSTGKIGVIKILSSSGAYWRGDHRNPMLQRVYGTAFFDKKALEAYVTRIEEARKRDHRKLGKELDLFHFHPYSPGAAFWTPKGTALYQTLSDWMRSLTAGDGYLEIKTPLMFNKGLWETSGHWGKYKENMFLVLDSESGEHDFSLKPMNCPSHHLFYGFKKHSYRDLPLRLHTQDVLHRNEAAGSLGGLTRVRQFAQDDAHIYCMESQITDEVRRFVKLLDRVYKAVGLTYAVKLSTRPEQRLGDESLWDRAEGGLKAALESLGLEYELAPGDGAFYGPKIDFAVSDSIGRKWQLGTMQLDYLAPERFDLTYVGEDNAPHRPVVLHRAIFGSFERFTAILIEHFAGAFPAWLAPVQAILVTVADRQMDYARKVRDDLRAKGFRVELDERGITLNAKIREAQLQKIPFTLVVGDNEVEAGAVAPRRYGGEDLKTMKYADFEALLIKEATLP
ncbi:threonine--tRNA ligase [Corallococcus exiguus]|uniref:threonine--tRNA ligase n=1 Tax=Corallococcus TaxID=83461 RepID=UPI000EDEFBA8|nr:MULTISPECIES: threonine--tRNA ligase [Corallococcus]NNB85283.1 threonine--tRNA ligase [Corallococcus exiguus]NNC01549.1 threonine--tRNA ligase [Corallococcus exiguus]NNC14848.1 threonine--tRNA ligase [Corallococcus exiguus]NPC45708.1 threonine--tRNA ligase [Corallococcus exiguus]NRD51972.1 threonine--tRNA ligase [Corallococcus exiguus]